MARKTGSNGEKTALQLRHAATVLFARSGYAAVSMRQIAREVGVQAGALYLYTADKQTLLFDRSEEHTSELQSRRNLVCRLLLEKKKLTKTNPNSILLTNASTR